VGRLTVHLEGQYSFRNLSNSSLGRIGLHVTTVNNIEALAEPIRVRTIQKLRLRILPYLLLLYVIAYLDRINIGFAALTMNKELAIGSQQFGLLVGIFFFGYFLFEIPSNLLLHKFGARVWISRILITWGTVAMLTGFVHTVHQLYVARFLLGLAEAGYSPGIILYLTYWFRQRERAQAIALFLTGLPITSILGAPISGVILDHVHWFGISSWRWLLVLEGVPAVICGVLTYFALPSRPSEAKFLSDEEKRWITQELDQEERQIRLKKNISPVEALMSRRVWHLASIGFTLNIGMYSLSFWMPQLVKSLSSLYSNTRIGLLVTIPHVVGFLAMVLVSTSSDRKMERKYHAAIPAMIAGIALVSLGATHSAFSSIFFLSFASIGIYSVYGPYWAIPSEFLTGIAAASGIALIHSVANLGGFAGPYAIGIVSQKTGSLIGGLALTGVSLFICATLALLLPKGSLARDD
jgi:ACS family tartrate transporter-like MFS transporter